jgi:hypothetical protein
MTSQLVQMIQERIGLVTSEFNAMELTPEPIRKLKGGKGETTLLYARFKHRQGIYFILRNEDLNSVVYIGRTGDGDKENGLADRLWGHLESNSYLRQRLQTENINLDGCFVVTLEVSDRVRRIQLEHLAIGIFAPRANVG